MSPVEWSPCCPRTIHLPLTASPCGRLSRPRSTISQYDFHSVVRPPSPCRLVGPYKLAFEPLNRMDLPCSHASLCLHAGGKNPGSIPECSPIDASWDSAFPFEGQGRLLRSRSISGLFSRSLHSGLQPPCLRFAVAVTGHHARLGTRLLAKLYRGRHSRRLGYMRFQGATRTDPSVRC